MCCSFMQQLLMPNTTTLAEVLSINVIIQWTDKNKDYDKLTKGLSSELVLHVIEFTIMEI